MIYITGDTHSDFHRFSSRIFTEQKEMSKKDHVIICGDFGGVWHKKGSALQTGKEDHELDLLANRSFTTLFIPGNHENYDRLMGDEFPETEWNGGRVKVVRPSILMLMCGEMYEIEGKKFFAFGGAASHDIQDGILDGNDPDWRKKAKRLDIQGKYMYRVKGLSWWPEELPSKEEMEHGIETLEKHQWKTDFVITHEAPASDLILLGQGFYKPDGFSKYLESIKQRLNYKHWFFGHYHMEKSVNSSSHVIYEQISRIV